jgi:hypothetical protein
MSDAAFGFVPIRHMSGNAPRTNKYTIATGLAENIFKGDLCIITADGVITPHSATEVNNIGVFDGARIPLQTDLISIANIGQLAQPLQTLSRMYTMIHTPYSVCNPQVLLLRPTLATALTL